MRGIQQIKKLFLNEKGLVLFGIVSGVLIHFVKLANLLFNHDSMVLYYSDTSWALSQGKWFSNPLTTFKGSLSVRYTAGLIGIFLIVISGMLLIEILEIYDAMSKRIVMLLLLASPSVMLFLIYDLADYFGATFLLAVLSVYIGRGYNHLAWLFATVCLTLSIGAYQGDIGVAAVLFLYICIKKMFLLKDSIGNVIKEGVYYISILLTAAVSYYIILQISLRINGVELAEYKGVDNMMSILRPGTLFWATVNAYKDSISFLWNDRLGTGEAFTVFLYRLLVIAIVLTVLSGLFKLLKEKQYLRALLSLVLIGLVPLAANLVGVLSNNSSFYLVTAYPLVLLFVLGHCLFFEYIRGKKYQEMAGWGIYVFMMAIIINMFLMVNVQYEKAKYASMQINAKMIELATLMHSVDGVNKDTPVVLIGNSPFLFLKARGAASIYEPFIIDGVDNALSTIGDVSRIQAYLEGNLSYRFNFDRLEEEPSQEMIDMPIYPDRGSIILDDEGRLIVKVGEVYKD